MSTPVLDAMRRLWWKVIDSKPLYLAHRRLVFVMHRDDYDAYAREVNGETVELLQTEFPVGIGPDGPGVGAPRSMAYQGVALKWSLDERRGRVRLVDELGEEGIWYGRGAEAEAGGGVPGGDGGERAGAGGEGPRA